MIQNIKHQEKLDDLRQSVENAISTLKISLNALDKAIFRKKLKVNL